MHSLFLSFLRASLFRVFFSFFTHFHTPINLLTSINLLPPSQSALKNAFAGRTVVIVAHRLATVQDVDRVVVLKDGAVQEEGAPAELRRRPGGAFADLLQKQSLVLA